MGGDDFSERIDKLVVDVDAWQPVVKHIEHLFEVAGEKYKTKTITSSDISKLGGEILRELISKFPQFEFQFPVQPSQIELAAASVVASKSFGEKKQYKLVLYRSDIDGRFTLVIPEK